MVVEQVGPWRFVDPIETPTMPCPTCGRANDAMTGISGERVPADGDVSLCAYCATIGVFDDVTTARPRVRLPTAEEAAVLDADEQLQHVRAAAAALVRERASRRAAGRPESFQCPRCEAVSHHPEDVAAGYCGRCHAFTGRDS